MMVVINVHNPEPLSATVILSKGERGRKGGRNVHKQGKELEMS